MGKIASPCRVETPTTHHLRDYVFDLEKSYKPKTTITNHLRDYVPTLKIHKGVAIFPRIGRYKTDCTILGVLFLQLKLS